jgi:hypothetical protein
MYFGISLVDVSYDRGGIQRAILPPDDPDDYTTDVCGRVEGDLNQCGERPALFYDSEVKPKAFALKYGYQINRHVSLELRGAIGVSEPDLELYSESIETQLGNIPGYQQTLLKVRTTPRDARLIMNSSFGLYARLGGTKNHPIRLKTKFIDVAPYLLVGHERVKFSTTIDGGTADTHTDDFSYGVGFNFYIFKEAPVLINVEWRELEKDFSSNSTKLELGQLSAGVEFLF